VRGENPDLWIDYPAVLVARGNLAAPQEVSAERLPDNDIVIKWSYNRRSDKKRARDKTLALAYFPEAQQGIWSIDDGVVRADEQIRLKLPDMAADKETHLYLAFAAVNGSDASDSVYVDMG